jgi:hypothetical protein
MRQTFDTDGDKPSSLFGYNVKSICSFSHWESGNSLERIATATEAGTMSAENARCSRHIPSSHRKVVDRCQNHRVVPPLVAPPVDVPPIEASLIGPSLVVVASGLLVFVFALLAALLVALPPAGPPASPPPVGMLLVVPLVVSLVVVGVLSVVAPAVVAVAVLSTSSVVPPEVALPVVTWSRSHRWKTGLYLWEEEAKRVKQVRSLGDTFDRKMAIKRGEKVIYPVNSCARTVSGTIPCQSPSLRK